MEAIVLGYMLTFCDDVNADLARFPDRQTVEAARNFNKAYQRHLEATIALYPHYPSPWRRLHRAQRHYQVWDALDDAQVYHEPDRRFQALQELRRLLGEDNYFRGRMPSPVPLEDFQEID